MSAEVLNESKHFLLTTKNVFFYLGSSMLIRRHFIDERQFGGFIYIQGVSERMIFFLITNNDS